MRDTADNDEAEGTAAKTTKCISFLHLDLGIGGAEQLVLQLAHASRELGFEVELWTTRCDAGTFRFLFLFVALLTTSR